MVPQPVLQAFGLQDSPSLQPLSTGLIHHSCKVTVPQRGAFLLQRMNTAVFPDPAAIQENYRQVQAHLEAKESFRLPDLIPTTGGDAFLQVEDGSWRCFRFITGAYSPMVAATPEQAYAVAACFGRFSASLSDLHPASVKTILPGFHDLDLRFRQFEEAVGEAGGERAKNAAPLVERLLQKKYLTEWYRSVAARPQCYPLRLLHHDCKISNILFEEGSDRILCPVDLDTTQPGFFFSDIGDMIRSMVPSVPEGSTDWEALEVRTEFYEAIREGYLQTMGAHLLPEERAGLHFSGPVLVYMQALRFLADYLRGDVYYAVTYGEQNRDRARNQLLLLEDLERYLRLPG